MEDVHSQELGSQAQVLNIRIISNQEIIIQKKRAMQGVGVADQGQRRKNQKNYNIKP
jgi:hypothetical protein